MEPEFKFDFEFLSEVPVREIALALWGDGDFNGASDAQMARFARAFHCSMVQHTTVLRKSGENYYRHDCRVAARALKAGFDLDIVTAILAHEFKEDDGWTEEQLIKIFGPEVASYVIPVSKRPKALFSSRMERLIDHIYNMVKAILSGLWQVAIIKVLDRLENTTDTAGLSDEDKARLFGETETHFLPFFRWAAKFIPAEWQMIYGIWIQAIEFACDNYNRHQNILRLQNSNSV
ncbi:MAG: GTP pyrophosphokinase, GTP pyrophosphokinase [Berkelbacteria bacterium GW2011_GWE1_39_12]|uniref:GTP pyrophosphokinase, GTP pyrophosphokinase n=1 Tax=Berkelbacteria bacterium GW2011_GWE1_39_12 TaxID=1618337 RepID=A0A0G4B3S4_9BACT|nr:MAG: GTP pyrophosphokinase, GTP pyrophosphokinase [Berkelbacteria bacterium GW2011_GWE1_39_12]